MQYVANDIHCQNEWKPFVVADKAARMRSMQAPEGIGDRLRTVAFAELQARDAFLWGAKTFPEAPEFLRKCWLDFAETENRHAQMLLDRIAELNVSIPERAVSNTLFQCFLCADSAELFQYLISTAEKRGMDIGFSMCEPMRAVDAKSAAIFHQIAEEEIEHVETADKILAEFDLLALKSRAKSLWKH